MSQDDRPSMEERYIRATTSSSLHLPSDPSTRTDADVLLAAGYVAAGDKRALLALRFYRLKLTGNMHGFNELAEIAGGWLKNRSRSRGRKALNRAQAIDLARRALFWWLNQVCTPCSGRGHPLMPNSPVINYGHDCPVCRGTGKYPVHRIVPAGTTDEARWLVDELDNYCGIVFGDMAKRLATSLDF